jgi:hypothetical protein
MGACVFKMPAAPITPAQWTHMLRMVQDASYGEQYPVKGAPRV